MGTTVAYELVKHVEMLLRGLQTNGSLAQRVPTEALCWVAKERAERCVDKRVAPWRGMACRRGVVLFYEEGCASSKFTYWVNVFEVRRVELYRVELCLVELSCAVLS